VLLAIIIQFRYSKVVILRSYLNRAFFGSHLIGADRAARSLFGSDPDSLSLENAALLAAMLVYPRPQVGGDAWLGRVRRRAEYGVRVYVGNKKRFDQLPG
jgi:membrane carboxypeptidase/penicillin-binding protein PbpC